MWYIELMAQITREERSRVLQALSVEEKLDSLERESADLYELNPEYCINRFIISFQQKRKNETERDSQTAG